MEVAKKAEFITKETTDKSIRKPFGLTGTVEDFTRLMQIVLELLSEKLVKN